MTAAEREGYNAWLAGKDPDRNPYSPDELLRHDEWVRGWCLATDDFADTYE